MFNSLLVTAQAQANSTCFMLDETGKSINLGALCQKSSSPPDQNSDSASQTSLPYGYSDHQKQQEVYIVPIKSRRGGIPVIDVTFNNRYVFEMMLDTGASEIVITQQMAQTLNVQHYRNVWVSTPSSKQVAMSSGYLYSVSVADLWQTNPLVITSPSMDMGLLGQSFFGAYDLTIKSDVIEFRAR